MMSDSGKKEKRDKFQLRVAGQPALEPPKPRPIPDQHPAKLLFGLKPDDAAAQAAPGPSGDDPSVSTQPPSLPPVEADQLEPPPTAAQAVPTPAQPEVRGEAAKPDAARERTPRTPRPPAQGKVPATFEEFKERWGRLLRSGERTGKLRVCEVVYQNTHAVGRTTYFVAYGKLAELCGLSKSVAKTNVKQLEEMGFLERLRTYNTATKKGSEYRLHLEPLRPEERRGTTVILFD